MLVILNEDEERNHVTVCAGFVSDYGIVLCADSQETRGAMKFDAPKLVIRPSVGEPDDKVRMIFAGAGHGPFIDKLVDEMWRAANQGANMQFEDVFERIEDANLRWHERVWKVYGNSDRPLTEILFAVHVPPGKPRLYRTTGPIVNRIENYAFVGCGEELGSFLTDHFRPDSVYVEEDVAAGLFILENVKKYVDSCGGDTQLAALMVDGSIHELARWDGKRLSDGISSIAQETNYLFSEAMNLESKQSDLNATMKSVMKSIREIRTELRKEIKHRIKVPAQLKKSIECSYRRIEWPPTQIPAPQRSETSEDQP